MTSTKVSFWSFVAFKNRKYFRPRFFKSHQANWLRNVNITDSLQKFNLQSFAKILPRKWFNNLEQIFSWRKSFQINLKCSVDKHSPISYWRSMWTCLIGLYQNWDTWTNLTYPNLGFGIILGWHSVAHIIKLQYSNLQCRTRLSRLQWVASIGTYVVLYNIVNYNMVIL